MAVGSTVLPDAGDKARKSTDAVVELGVGGEEGKRTVVTVKVLVYRSDALLGALALGYLGKDRQVWELR